MDLIEVLKSNKIYIYEKNVTDFLIDSYAYKLGKSIRFSKIKGDPQNIESFINLTYEQAFANISKSALYIDGSNINLYEVYNTEINTGENAYFFANTMLFFSSFLNKCYNTDAIIIRGIDTYNDYSKLFDKTKFGLFIFYISL